MVIIMSNKEQKEVPPEKKIVVCISGLAGTGKSTLSKKIAAKSICFFKSLMCFFIIPDKLDNPSPF